MQLLHVLRLLYRYSPLNLIESIALRPSIFSIRWNICMTTSSTNYSWFSWSIFSENTAMATVIEFFIAPVSRFFLIVFVSCINNFLCRPIFFFHSMKFVRGTWVQKIINWMFLETVQDKKTLKNKDKEAIEVIRNFKLNTLCGVYFHFRYPVDYFDQTII